VACKLEGFQFVGMEQDSEYSKIAQARIENYVEDGNKKKIKPKMTSLDGKDMWLGKW
jgi:DNA modification methylase